MTKSEKSRLAVALVRNLTKSVTRRAKACLKTGVWKGVTRGKVRIS